MNMIQEQLARRYATAFLNLFGDQIAVADAERINRAYRALHHAHEFIFILGMPVLSADTKWKMIDEFFAVYALPERLKKLVRLLMDQGRISLLPVVFKHMWWIYLERNDMMHMRVASSCELDDTQRQSIENFTSHKTGTKNIYAYRVDQRLIAGIRLQSDTVLWDNSIRVRLNAAARLLQV